MTKPTSPPNHPEIYITPSKTRLHKLLFDEVYSNPVKYKSLLLSESAYDQIKAVEEAMESIKKEYFPIERLGFYSKLNTHDGKTIQSYIDINLIGSNKKVFKIYLEDREELKLQKWNKNQIEQFVSFLVAWELKAQQMYKRYQAFSIYNFNRKETPTSYVGTANKLLGVTLKAEVTSVSNNQMHFRVDVEIPGYHFTFKPTVSAKYKKTILKTYAVRFFNAIKMMAIKDTPILGLDFL